MRGEPSTACHPMIADGSCCAPSLRFDARASHYHQYADVQIVMAEWLSEQIPDAVVVGRQVLELGAGTGLFTRKLVDRGARVQATDVAPAMVAEGRSRCPEAAWSTLDAWSEWSGRPSDCLCSASLLQWCPDPQEILHRWHRTLRPGSACWHGFYIQPSLSALYALLPPAVAPVLWRPAAFWVDAFASAGFEVVHAQTRTVRIPYQSPLVLWRHLHGIGAHPARAQLSAVALRAIMRAYASHCPHPDGGVYAAWELMSLGTIRR